MWLREFFPRLGEDWESVLEPWLGLTSSALALLPTPEPKARLQQHTERAQGLESPPCRSVLLLQPLRTAVGCATSWEAPLASPTSVRQKNPGAPGCPVAKPRPFAGSPASPPGLWRAQDAGPKKSVLNQPKLARSMLSLHTRIVLQSQESDAVRRKGFFQTPGKRGNKLGRSKGCNKYTSKSTNQSINKSINRLKAGSDPYQHY